MNRVDRRLDPDRYRRGWVMNPVCVDWFRARQEVPSPGPLRLVQGPDGYWVSRKPEAVEESPTALTGAEILQAMTEVA